MERKPHCLIVIGMAGSGKSSVVRKLYQTLATEDKNVFGINLDPAIKKLSFPAHIDICSSINFRSLMKEYQLGPNGAIMTALNTYTIRFHEAIDIANSRDDLDYILVDTPGQIEAFTWSASGMLIADALATSFPTSLIYVVDTTRVLSPNSFMANMLYATSIYFKTQIPMVLAFNKVDLASPEKPLEWMADFEAYINSLDHEDNYVSSLNRSLALVIDTFYKDIPAASLSAHSGSGFRELVPLLAQSRTEYMNSYLPEVNRKKQEIDRMRARGEFTRFEEERQEDLDAMERLRALMGKVGMNNQ